MSTRPTPMVRHIAFAVLLNCMFLISSAAVLASQTQIIAARSGYVSESEARNVPVSSTHCGPKWAGGCWDVHQPQRGFGETLKMKSFYFPLAGLFASNIIDIEATRHSGCGEARQFGGKDWGQLYAEDMSVDAAVGAMAFFLKRGHIKIIPEAVLGYGIAIHTHGAIRGFNAHCN